MCAFKKERPGVGTRRAFLFEGEENFIRRKKGSRRLGRLRRCAVRVRGLWRRGRTRVRRRFSGPGREWRLLERRGGRRGVRPWGRGRRPRRGGGRGRRW